MNVLSDHTPVIERHRRRVTSVPVRRIAVLYSELSGYMAACLKALKVRHNIELLVFRWPVAKEAPFQDGNVLDWVDALYTKRDHRAEDILQIVKGFKPHGLLIPGWMDREYLSVAREMKKRGVPVIAGSDTPWEGTLRQWGGKILAPRWLHSAIDVLWVAGERQRSLARHLGFRGSRCWSGLYACDWERFGRVNADRNLDHPPAFLYVGRYSHEKGLDILLEAYRRYRSVVAHPWPLLCAGTGSQKQLLGRCEGIIDKGFVQPENLPALMRDAAALVLPSRKEPWGVVVQEAAAAGLPLVCSTACGASVSLLQDSYNGFLFESEDAIHLSECLIRMSKISKKDRAAMGARSHQLSRQFTPARWADTLVNGLQDQHNTLLQLKIGRRKNDVAKFVE